LRAYLLSKALKDAVAVEYNIKTVFIAGAILLIAGTGCLVLKRNMPAAPPEATSSSKQHELTEYDGRKLTPLKRFAQLSRGKPQQVDLKTYRLKITGLVEHPQSYTYSQVMAMKPRQKQVVTLHCVEGWTSTLLWEGIRFRDLVAEAKPKPGAKIAIIKSIDGYSTSLPLEYLNGGEIIIAGKINGVQAPPEAGFPFALTAKLKWGYKWAKYFDEIEFSDDTSYIGYWEQSGYDNGGDLDSPFMSGVKPSGCHKCHNGKRE
jgi:DMSO/TMAO reductase YedYZ molybdopterin-dependent catalytic subunit